MNVKLVNMIIGYVMALRSCFSTSFLQKNIAPTLLVFFFFFAAQTLQAQEIKQYIESHRNNLSFDNLMTLVCKSNNDSLELHLTKIYINTLQPNNNIEKIYFNSLKTTFNQNNLDVLLETSNNIKKISLYNNDIKLAKAIISLRIGGCYRIKNNHQAALQYYSEAYDIIKDLDIENYYINHNVFIGFGEFYLLNKLPDLALIKLKEAEKTLDKINNFELTVNCYNSIGLCYQQLKQWDLSNAYFQKIILFSKDKNKGQKFWIGLASGNIGDNYYRLKQYQLSLNYLTTDFQYSLEARNYIGAFHATILSAKIAFQLKKRKEARYWLANAEKLFPKEGGDKRHLAINEIKVLYYSDIKNYKAAFEIQEVNNILRDSISAKKERENILASTYKLEIEKKNQEIVFEQAYSKFSSIAFFVLFSLITIAFYTFYRQKQKQTKQAEEYQKKIENHVLELEQSNQFINNLFLIIAHDLKEPAHTFQDIVGNLNYLIKNKQYDSLLTIGTYAEKLSIHLSLTLDNLFKWGLLEQKKFEIQKNQHNLYKTILNIKYEIEILLEVKKLKLKINVPEDFEVNVDISIVSIILRNFVSNAIKFSVPSQTITINLEKKAENVFCLNVIDNGIGMDEEQQKQIFELTTTDRTTRGTMGERGSGIGLLLCRQLAELADMSITFTSEKDKGTTFSLCLK